MTTCQHNWYIDHIYWPIVTSRAADETEAAVNVIMREVFGENLDAFPCEPTEPVNTSEASHHS